MDDLITWLRAQIDEDETGHPTSRVLREAVAKRKILDQHSAIDRYCKIR